MSKKNRTHAHRRPPPRDVSPTVGCVVSGRSNTWNVWIARVGISVYVIWLIVVPPMWLDPTVRSLWRGPQLWVHGLVRGGFLAIGCGAPSKFLAVGAYYVLVSLIVPAVVCVLLRRIHPADTGWRKPNVLLLRIVTCSFLVSVPFLFWMVRSPEFAPYYQPYLDSGPRVVLTYYVVVLFCEHFFFEGVMLAAFRAGGRWPEPPKLIRDASTGWRHVAQWFGVAQPTGAARGCQRVTRWLGISDGCFGAILWSGALFGLVHWGKAGREFLLAFPGGVFLAALAYRCNSWHAPYLLHAGTVMAAAIMFLALHG